MKKIMYVIIGIALLTSCGPSKKVVTKAIYTPLPDSVQVVVLRSWEPLPPNVTFLGSGKIGDSGFSVKCREEVVIAEAINVSRKMGGNLIHITKHKGADIWSTCHRIWFDVYFRE